MSKRPWYKRLEVWGTVLQGISGLCLLFPIHTTAHAVGSAIGIVVGTGTQVAGLMKGYRADNLYPGISNMIDKIPNKYTGERGSAIDSTRSQ